MELIQALVLAVIQGVTEFLPISSSAHLILLPKIAAWPDQGLAFDVALNTGTTLAVCIYLRRELGRLFSGIMDKVRPSPYRYVHSEGRLLWLVIIATAPVLLAGFFFHDLVSGPLRSVEVIAWSSIGWGIALFFADRRPGMAGLNSIGWLLAVLMGIAQAIAIVPGTSRSGITMTAGLAFGLKRTSAARFSFLMAVPVGIIAGAYEFTKLFEPGGMHTPWALVFVGFIVSFASAYLTIHLFMQLIEKTSMTSFVIYRVLLGVFLLLIF